MSDKMQAKHHTNNLQTVFCRPQNPYMMENKRWGASLAASSHLACVCITRKLIVCSNAATWQSHVWNLLQEENKNIECCLSKHLCAICEQLPKQNATRSESRKLLRQHSSETNFPCYLLTVTSECKHGHACSMSLRGLETPRGEKCPSPLIFISTLTDRAWGGRDRPLLWCPPGGQMKASGFSIPL